MSPDLATSARAELAKAFVLASRGIDVQMFSSAIDKVWHEMLLDEKSYIEFSVAACGYIVPHDQRSDAGLVDFVDSYEQEYGRLPEIWFYDESGKLDAGRYDEYLETGEVIASWKCSATHNCMNILPPMREENPRDGDKEKAPITPKPPIVKK